MNFLDTLHELDDGCIEIFLAPHPAERHAHETDHRRLARIDGRLVARLGGAERIHRVEQLEVYAMDFEWLSSLARKLERRTAFTLTVSEQHLYLSLGEETFSGALKRVPVESRA